MCCIGRAHAKTTDTAMPYPSHSQYFWYALHMSRHIHTLMQNTHHLRCVLLYSTHDDMGTDKIKPVRVRQFPALVSKLRIRPSNTRVSFSLSR